MLLVDDQQPQVLEAHAGLQQPVRADDDVHLAVGETRECRLRLRVAPETRQQLDAHRPVGEAVRERLVVLLREQRGRDQYRDLLASLHCDECGAQRHLGLAESHVAANDPIHRPGRAQVFLDLRDRSGLVRGLLERESRRKCADLRFVHREGVSLARSTARIHVQQFRGRVPDPCRGPAAGLGPLVAAELVQRRGFRRRTGVTADPLERLHRHVELVAAGVLEHQELGQDAAGVHGREAEVAAYAVILVHDRRPGAQVGELLDDAGRVPVRPSPASLLPCALAEELLLGVQREQRFLQRNAGGERCDRDTERSVAREKLAPSRDGTWGDPARTQQVEQQFAATGRLRGEQHATRVRRERRCERIDRFLATLVEAQRWSGGAAEVDDDPRVTAVRRRFAAEREAQRRRDRRAPFVRRDEDLGGREHRVLDVVAALLEPLLDRTPCGDERGVVVGGHGNDSAAGQVVEQARRRVEIERQVILDAGRGEAVAYVAIDRHACQVALEARPEATAEIADRVCARRELAGRQQFEALELVAGALRLRVEAAHAVDLPVEEVDAQRQVAAHRENVEQRATDREFAGFADLRHARVAGRRQSQAECLEVEFLADAQRERVGVDECPRRKALQRRRQVGDDDAVLESRQPGKRAQPLRDDVRVRGELVVGQRLVARKQQDRQVRGREEAQFLLEAGGLRGVPRNEQDGRGRGCRRAREIHRGRGAGKARPAHARLPRPRDLCI